MGMSEQIRPGVSSEQSGAEEGKVLVEVNKIKQTLKHMGLQETAWSRSEVFSPTNSTPLFLSNWVERWRQWCWRQ